MQGPFGKCMNMQISIQYDNNVNFNFLDKDFYIKHFDSMGHYSMYSYPSCSYYLPSHILIIMIYLHVYLFLYGGAELFTILIGLKCIAVSINIWAV